MVQILISIYDHEVDLIHFHSQEREHNLKLFFAAKIITNQLLVGVEVGYRKKGKAGFLFFRVISLSKSLSTAHSAPVSINLWPDMIHLSPLDYHCTDMCQRNSLSKCYIIYRN